MNGTYKRYAISGTCVLGFILAAVIVVAAFKPVDYSGPWYGRGQNLPALPYDIVVGPVDPNSGIKGILEIGMSKPALRRSLGQAIVPALSDKEALDMTTRNPNDVDTGASLDISSFKNEFYGGEFAWIRYGKDGHVDLICLDPAAFQKKFHRKQTVAVSLNNGVVVVDQRTSQKYLIRLLDQMHVRYSVEQGNWVVIKDTRLMFRFGSKDKMLRDVNIIGSK